MNTTIVVGVDESSASKQAVEFAAREAGLRDWDLRLLHACTYPGRHEMWSASDEHPVNRLEPTMRKNAELARAVMPGVDVTTVVVIEDPVTALVKESRDAAALVVGSHGFGGFPELTVGSTALQLSSHAGCPVFVTRGRIRSDGPVVVGVDGSAHSDAVVGFAFAEASFRQVDLIAVHAWNHWTGPGETARGDDAPGERLLSEALAGWQQMYPDVPVRRRVVHHRARPALIEASDQAGLLVIGARGRDGFTGLLLGSTGYAMVQHARCPVTVVRS